VHGAKAKALIIFSLDSVLATNTGGWLKTEHDD